MGQFHFPINFYEGFEVFSAATMKDAIFWDVAPCRSCVTRCFGGTYRFHLHGRKVRVARNQREQMASRLRLATDLWSYRFLLLISYVTHSASLCSYIAGCFQLVAQSASHLLLLKAGSHKIYTAPHPRSRNSSIYEGNNIFNFSIST
jgi:hypothetical protein